MRQMLFVLDVVELVIVIVADAREFGEFVSFSWKLTLPPSGVEASEGLIFAPLTIKNPYGFATYPNAAA